MLRFLLATLVSTAVYVIAADAADRRVMVINNSHSTIMELYGSNRDRPTWEEDILGTRVIDPGERVRIDFNDGSGYCVFDLKAVMQNGEEMIQHGANVCEVATWTISD